MLSWVNMEKFKTVGTKVDPETLAKIDNLISNLGVTRSAWIKQVILRSLTGSEDRSTQACEPSAEPVSIPGNLEDPGSSHSPDLPAVIPEIAREEPKAKNAGLDWVGWLVIGLIFWGLWSQWRNGTLA